MIQAAPMKKLLLFLGTILPIWMGAQENIQAQNIIIVTTDGLRWQEVFKGMDSAIAANRQYNQEEYTHLFQLYWGTTEEERRKKLLPFLWSVIASNGQLYGNRIYKSKVDVSNKYWFSYPGYSEIFCGYADRKINSNNYGLNPKTNLLEFLEQQPGYSGKVSAFGAWDAFDRILNEKRSQFPVVCGRDSCGGLYPDETEKQINRQKRTEPNPFDSSEYRDVYTHDAAMHCLQKNKPRVLYIAYGETDTWAHYGQYAAYLNAAHQFDEWLAGLWNTIQNDTLYKDRTVLFITTDHGRGEGKLWTNHNRRTKGSNHIWFATMGQNIPAKGEMKERKKIKQKQFAQTMAGLLGLRFKCEHKVAKGISDLITGRKK
jgi:hypothetical protein